MAVPRFIPAVALLLAAGCSREPAPGDEGRAAIPAPTVSANEAPAAAGADPLTPGAATLREIPERFRGRWALGVVDCDPAKADVAKGLMVVEAGRLVFYEARGVPSRIAADGPDRLRLSLDYSGEGQTWAHDATLTLSRDGRTLTRDEPQADTGTETYARCPA